MDESLIVHLESPKLGQIPDENDALFKGVIDKGTDTSSAHKLNALKTATTNAFFSKTKEEFKDISSAELDFYEKVFRIANIAQDGCLNESELMFFLDQHDYVISKAQARQIVLHADANKDGTLDFREFLHLCTSTKVSLKEFGILSEDWETQLQNSTKIRTLFQRIFDSIQLAPSITDTVKFFESQSSTKIKLDIRSKTKRLLALHENQFDNYSTSLPGSESEFDFDLIVLGCSPGGLQVAKEAALAGKKVAVCDPTVIAPAATGKSIWQFGPGCISVGCVPKLLLRFAGTIGEALDTRVALPYGWASAEMCTRTRSRSRYSSPEFIHHWTTLVDNVQSHIRSHYDERLYNLVHYQGIHVFNGSFEFEEGHRVALTHYEDNKATESLTGEKIVISIGPTYKSLDIPGAAGNCITLDDLFSLRQHPGKVLIIGAGPDAIECAGLLCSLNIEVTVMSRDPALTGYDRRMVTLILECLHLRGVKIMIGWTPLEIQGRSGDNAKDKDPSPTSSAFNLLLGQQRRKSSKLTVTSKHIQTGERTKKEYDTVVLAIGKKPSTSLLNLEKAGILKDEASQKIWVDSNDMTTVEDVYAIGECVSHRPSGAASASLAGTALGQRLYGGGSAEPTDYEQTVPKLILTPVPYASAGLSEEEAKSEHGECNVEVYHSKFQPLQYQLSKRFKDVNYAKMITLKSENDLVVGLDYLGPNAGDVMQGFSLALKLGATKAQFDAMLPFHPTSAEIFSRMTKRSEEESSDFFLSYSGS